MQQPRQAGFGGGFGAHRGSELCCQLGDVAKMFGQRLPFAGRFRDALALIVFGGVGVVSHGRFRDAALGSIYALHDAAQSIAPGGTPDVPPAFFKRFFLRPAISTA